MLPEAARVADDEAEGAAPKSGGAAGVAAGPAEPVDAVGALAAAAGCPNDEKGDAAGGLLPRKRPGPDGAVESSDCGADVLSLLNIDFPAPPNENVECGVLDGAGALNPPNKPPLAGADASAFAASFVSFEEPAGLLAAPAKRFTGG